MARQHRPGRHDPIPALEWASAAVGAMVALLLVGTLVAHGLKSARPPPPNLSVAAVGMASSGGGFLVAFDVANASPQTAASVQIEGRLNQGATEIETSRATIDYVPGGSSAKGGLIFAADPRTHRLELRVTGYELP